MYFWHIQDIIRLWSIKSSRRMFSTWKGTFYFSICPGLLMGKLVFHHSMNVQWNFSVWIESTKRKDFLIIFGNRRVQGKNRLFHTKRTKYLLYKQTKSTSKSNQEFLFLSIAYTRKLSIAYTRSTRAINEHYNKLCKMQLCLHFWSKSQSGHSHALKKALNNTTFLLFA